MNNYVNECLLNSIVGLGKAIECLNTQQQKTDKLLKASIKANYKSSTTEGKKRFASELLNEYGSQKEVACILGLSGGRISQLIKYLKQNGR